MLCCDPGLQVLMSRHQHLASWCSIRHVLHQMQRRSVCRVQNLSRPPSQLPPWLFTSSSRHTGLSPNKCLEPTTSTAAALLQPAAPSSQILGALSPPPLVLMAAPEQQQQQQQTPRNPKSRTEKDDKEAIKRIKGELNRLQARSTIKYNNPCKVSANYSKTCTPYELNVVKYHLEEFIPRFFVSLMDYSLFTPNIVYINEMRTQPKISRGVYRLSLDRLKLKLYYDMRYALKKPIIMRIDTDHANSCMAVRLRVRCMGGAKPFTDIGEINRLGMAQYIEQKGEWHDYLLHVHVTDDARVWQLRITNLTEDKGENPVQANAQTSLVQRVRQLLRRRAPLPTPV